MVDIARVDLICFRVSFIVARRIIAVRPTILRPKLLNKSIYRSTKLLASGRITDSLNRSPMISKLLPCCYFRESYVHTLIRRSVFSACTPPSMSIT